MVNLIAAPWLWRVDEQVGHADRQILSHLVLNYGPCAPLIASRIRIAIAGLGEIEVFAINAGTHALGNGMRVAEPLPKPDLHPVRSIKKPLLYSGARGDSSAAQAKLLVGAQFGFAARLKHANPAANAKPVACILIDIEPKSLLFIAAPLFAPARSCIESKARILVQIRLSDSIHPQLHIFVLRKRT